MPKDSGDSSAALIDRELDTSEGSGLLTFALLKGLPVHIARLDPAGTVRDTNHTWLDAALPTAGPPLLSEVGEGENYLALCARSAATGDRLAEEARQGIEQVLRGESRSFSLEYSCTTLPETNWYMLHAVSLLSPDDGAIVAHLDVTRHKRAQEHRSELQRALERAALEWRSTFDAIESPILLLAMDGRLRRLNRAARNLLGRDYREVVGLPVAELGRGQPWETVTALAHRAAEGSPVEVGEARDERKSKTWEVEVTVAAGTEEGEARIIVQLRDITKTERLQESLRRSETMAVLGAVVGGVAHEVRNPLFGMTSVLDAFEARFGDRPEFHPYLPLLRTELGRMIDLMQALLDYGKPPRFEMAPRPVAEPVGAALELCRPLAERRQARLEADLAAVCPVFCDLHRLTQAIKNLVDNAVQHSPAGGRVVVRTLPLQVEGEDWVRLTVRDQGPGFPAADLPRVLEPFFSRRKGGTGLGLSIVSRVVEGHGGSLRLDNDAGGGALVEIALPCAPRTPLPGGE